MNRRETVNPSDDRAAWSERLQVATILHGLHDEERAALLRLMVFDRFTSNEVIIRQETMTRNLWLLLEGQCEVLKEPAIGSFGATVPLAQLQPFDVFGEMTLISAVPHVASVETRSDVLTLRLRGRDFDQLVDNQPRLACRLACNLVVILSDRLRSVDEKLSHNLDQHETLQAHHAWEEIRGRLGKLYAGTPQ